MAQGHAQRRGEAEGEEVRGQRRVGGQLRVRLTRGEDDDVLAHDRPSVAGLRVAEHLEHRVDNAPRVGAVEHEDTRRAQPALQVVHRERDVLRERAVEDPDLAVDCGARHAVPVEVQQQPLVLARVAPAQRYACLLDVLERGVEAELVPGARLPALVLRLQRLRDDLERLLRRQRRVRDADLNTGHANRRPSWLDSVGRVDAKVEAQHNADRHSLRALLDAPGRHVVLRVRGAAGLRLNYGAAVGQRGFVPPRYTGMCYEVLQRLVEKDRRRVRHGSAACAASAARPPRRRVRTASFTPNECGGHVADCRTIR